jgi:hypothetical protein
MVRDFLAMGRRAVEVERLVTAAKRRARAVCPQELLLSHGDIPNVAFQP